MNYDDHYWGMHMGWWILWVIILILIIGILYTAPWQTTKKNTPLDILKERFAKGEITKREYEDHKKLLQQH